MKLKDYIELLQKLQAEHGEDIEVCKYFGDERVAARQPRLGYTLILKGRERKQRFWTTYDGEAYQGKKVICL